MNIYHGTVVVSVYKPDEPSVTWELWYDNERSEHRRMMAHLLQKWWGQGYIVESLSGEPEEGLLNIGQVWAEMFPQSPTP